MHDIHYISDQNKTENILDEQNWTKLHNFQDSIRPANRRRDQQIQNTTNSRDCSYQN